ncbi:unnamed protein product [Arctogadus glacialis]
MPAAMCSKLAAPGDRQAGSIISASKKFGASCPREAHRKNTPAQQIRRKTRKIIIPSVYAAVQTAGLTGPLVHLITPPRPALVATHNSELLPPYQWPWLGRLRPLLRSPGGATLGDGAGGTAGEVYEAYKVVVAGQAGVSGTLPLPFGNTLAGTAQHSRADDAGMQE